MEQNRYTVVAPTTGSMVRIERVRARPRLQASYAALKGDFRPLALSADYHNFVSGPIAAHGISEGAHELLISEDIDSGRSWEIPVLIAHLLQRTERLLTPDGDKDSDKLPDIIWATGSVDPELHPQAADYAVARKCEIAAPLFAEWSSASRSVQLIVPAGMPEADVEAVTQAASDNNFDLTIVGTFDELAAAIGHNVQPSPDLAQSNAAFSDSATTAAPRPAWLRPAPLAGSMIALVAAAGLTLYALGSVSSNQTATTDTAPGFGSDNEGKDSPITLVRLGAGNRADCIERIMLTQQMDLTTIPMTNGAYRINKTEGLCGLRFINQSTKALNIRLSGDLVTAAIRGNDALSQGVSLPASDATDLIFSQRASGLTASLQLDGAAIPVIIDAGKGENQ